VSPAPLAVEPLEEAAFAPFGHVLGQPPGRPDAEGPGWRWWAETALVPAAERPYGVGYLRLEPSRRQFDWAERHMRSVEAIVPLEGAVLVYVAPPDHPDEPGRLADLERFRVFRVPPGQGVILARGVWHGAPLAVDGPAAALVLLLERTGSEDTAVVRFEQTPLAIAEEGARHASG
jgi:ureidoglycolate hydrolase